MLFGPSLHYKYAFIPLTYGGADTLTYSCMGSGEATSEINLNGYLGNPITVSIALP